MVEFTPVASSNIAALGYDAETQTLYVNFTSGGHYTYSDVPQEVYEDFLHSASPGRYFHNNIKDIYPLSRA